MASSQVSLKALGLNYSPNNLALPEGSLVEANDVIIRRDNVIESRRGLNDYSEPVNNDIKQILEYKERILLHYGNKLAFDTLEKNLDDKNFIQDFAGTYNETENGLRIKSLIANKNLYFTTEDGIKKLSVKNATDFNSNSGLIVNAGAVKAVDFSSVLEVQQGQINGFLPVDGAVAYRVVWGYKDQNDNLLLGTPSERNVVYNFLSDLVPDDINVFLLALDNLDQSTSLITDGNYFSSLNVNLNTSAANLQSTVLSLATKIDQDIVYADTAGTYGLTISDLSVSANLATVSFSAGDATLFLQIGDKIRCFNFDANSSTQTFFNNPESNKFWTLVDVQPTFIQFVIPNSTNFTPTAASTGSGTPTIESYNYRGITETGDSNFVTPLSDLVIGSFPNSQDYRIIQNNILRFADRLLSELPDIVPASLLNSYIEPYNVTQSGNATLNITIPSGILKPDGSTDYFVQIYRSRNFVAREIQSLGPGGAVSVEPDDELRLVFETFPTSTDLTNGFIEYFDTYPEDLAINNANLYTNPVTGSGILQANDIPPFAKDISSFKGVTFYLNTKTKQRLNPFQLIGITEIINSPTKEITIATETNSNTYKFVLGVQQEVQFTFNAASPSDLQNALQNRFFNINTPTRKLYFWFRYDGAGSPSPDAIPTDGIAIPVDLLTGDTVATVATKITNTANSASYDIQATLITTTPNAVINFTCFDSGITEPPVLDILPNGNINTSLLSPATLTVLVAGDGEDALANPPKVLLSNNISRAQAIDETARSLVRVINKQNNSTVYAYYISGDNISPGIINLEAKNLSDKEFYILGSDGGVGLSFTPDISPTFEGGLISGAGFTYTITIPNHGFINGDKVFISGSNSTPKINGIYTVINATTNTFQITGSSAFVSSGSFCSVSLLSDVSVSNNEQKPNRVYYSKLSQPESVPILNYFDLGSSDKEGLRLFPLRDSLFVFKEDGLYRISGESEPFVTGLFDSSCIVIAPDSVDISNNVIYAWTTKGISNITESGVVEISRPIDTQILKISSASYPNFKKVTWGVGYDSDNSYTVFTNTNPNDTYATIGFRYSDLTNTWTNIIRPQGCGIVSSFDDKLYTGNNIDRVINQERKDFTRTDYADSDFFLFLGGGSTENNGLKLGFNDVSDIDKGDVIQQEQTLTIDTFNALLKKLDIDPGIDENDFYSTLKAERGDNLRDKIVALAVKLDNNPNTNNAYLPEIDTNMAFVNEIITGANSTIFRINVNADLINGRVVSFIINDPTSVSNLNIDLSTLTKPIQNVNNSVGFFEMAIPSNTLNGAPSISLTAGDVIYTTLPNELDINDIKVCYNKIISLLNTDTGVVYENYLPLTDNTFIEAVVTDVNITNNFVLVNLPIQWTVGRVRVYNKINCKLTYAPITFGDALSYKQVYQATMMFDNRAFTSAKMGFASDLKPEFFEIEFNGDGNGIFGHYSNPGFGYGFFGGGSNAVPFRTIIPRKSQRCRFINVNFKHEIAREQWAIYGVTLTGNLQVSERAYRS